MKILSIENTIFDLQNSTPISFACYPDTSIIRNNDNFYIPNFSNQIVAQIGVYVSFSKIGKHISPQFIPRYYKEYGVAINFIAVDTLQQCKELNISTDFARGFDHSFAISTQHIQNQNIAIHDAEFAVSYNLEKHIISLQSIITHIHQLISQSSNYFTIKIGDIFFIPCISISNTITISDSFDISIQNKNILHCEVK